ncbi:MAG: EVE domain-containing protein [Chloroflexota bacterium]|nr:EVE domain-containing protein [Chloroflexota bacterium]MDE2960578.1 EVE domain-containing protein [Chloroflexota bacterium]
MPHNFWMINCNEENYNVTRRMGFTGQGLKAEYRRKVQRVEPGDRVIYYVTGTRVFTATATVTRGYEEVDSSPWIKEGKAAWPYRIGIKPDVILRDEQFISAGLIAYRLEYVRKWAPEDWYMAFQGNLHLLSKSDFFLLEGEMLKLRDGRLKALEQIDAALAAEEERVNAQRERRRRNANRNNARTPAPRTDAASDNQPPAVETPAPTGDEAAVAADPETTAGQGSNNGRGRRNSRNRGGNRRSAPRQSPRYDSE